MQTKGLTKFDNFDHLGLFVEERLGEFVKIGPTGWNPDSLKTQLLIAVTNNRKLLGCTPQSMYLALNKAVKYGLDISGMTQEAWLVPYKNQVQCQTGYKGEVKVLMRPGNVKEIKAAVVYEHDFFDYVDGVKTDIVHKPLIKGDRGEFTCAWAIILFKDGGMRHGFMRADEIALHEKMSKAKGQADPWNKWADMMRTKTVLRRATRFVAEDDSLYAEFRRDMDSQWEGDQQLYGEDTGGSSVDELNQKLGLDKGEIVYSETEVRQNPEPAPPPPQNPDPIKKPPRATKSATPPPKAEKPEVPPPPSDDDMWGPQPEAPPPAKKTQAKAKTTQTKRTQKVKERDKKSPPAAAPPPPSDDDFFSEDPFADPAEKVDTETGEVVEAGADGDEGQFPMF